MYSICAKQHLFWSYFAFYAIIPKMHLFQFYGSNLLVKWYSHVKVNPLFNIFDQSTMKYSNNCLSSMYMWKRKCLLYWFILSLNRNKKGIQYSKTLIHLWRVNTQMNNGQQYPLHVFILWKRVFFKLSFLLVFNITLYGSGGERLNRCSK